MNGREQVVYDAAQPDVAAVNIENEHECPNLVEFPRVSRE